MVLEEVVDQGWLRLPLKMPLLYLAEQDLAQQRIYQHQPMVEERGIWVEDVLGVMILLVATLIEEGRAPFQVF